MTAHAYRFEHRVAPTRSARALQASGHPQYRLIDTASGLPRVIGPEAARELGLTRSAVRHAIGRYGWQPLARGVVLTARGRPTRADWAAAGLELAGPQAAVSGWDAVRCYELGSLRPPTETVLILDRGGHNRLVSGRIRIRPTGRSYASEPRSARAGSLPGLPVVPPARAVADAALDYARFAPVRAITTAAIQRGLCTPIQLLAELEECPRNGSGWLRRALEDVLDGARSVAEAEAVDWLRHVQVPAFELNVPILNAAGVKIAVADALWRELRAVLEVDSREYHFAEADWKYTSRRHNRLTSGGLALTHCPPSEIREGRLGWAQGIQQWLRGRAAELGVEYRPDPRVIRPGSAGPRPFRLLS